MSTAFIKKAIPLLMGLFLTCHLAGAVWVLPEIDTLGPEDVVQDSIKIRQVGLAGTNNFAVFFTYTEAGARRMLAFSEAHAGQKIQTRIGEFLFPEGVCYAPGNAEEYRKWKEGWLKVRTSKFLSLSKADAEAVVAGLKATATKKSR